jgi:uncharacterized surface protein with fasciclin (FAS1) repeats
MHNPLPRRAAVLALGSLALAACGGDSDHPPDLVGGVQADSELSVLAEAVAAAGLAGTLSGAGPFTLLAPTNAAFAALLTELNVSKAQLLANVPLLTQVLSYHLLAGRVSRNDVPLGKAIAPSGGGFFKMESVSGQLTFTDGRNRTGRITQTDVAASNGLIHKVDRVLLPANQNIVQTAQSLPAFSILVEAVAAAGLVDTLSGVGPFTVFAPTNTAFTALLADFGITKAQLLANKALLTQVLTYHVLPSRVLKADVPVGPAITTVQGETFTVDSTLSITDRNARKSGITATDVFNSNGVIHVIDKVLLPKVPNIVELAQSQPQFSILVEAVVAAGLVSALSGPTAITVFAPTNDAFAGLLAELNLTKAQLLANTTLLTQVLTYHVVPGRIYANNLPSAQAVTTLGGGQFTVNGALVVTDARNRQSSITATDALALNGVVHTLGRVLLPPP